MKHRKAMWLVMQAGSDSMGCGGEMIALVNSPTVALSAAEESEEDACTIFSCEMVNGVMSNEEEVLAWKRGGSYEAFEKPRDTESEGSDG